MNAALTLGRNMFKQVSEAAAAAPPSERAMLTSLIAYGDELLTQAKIERKGSMVSARTATKADLRQLVQVALPALLAARTAAARAQSANNLKQLALAMHNYHDVNGRFPPAVVVGPDGKTTHSWRVAILPYLDQSTLYGQYNVNEPWDGPNNRKLLARIPAVYRAAPDDTSTNTSYFALTGGGSIFDTKEGSALRDIVDGTLNTILFVEAKREIPWLKPEDLPYDPTGELPTLGGFSPGGFNTAFADGAVRFLSATIDKTTLRALITRAGSEVINQ